MNDALVCQQSANGKFLQVVCKACRRIVTELPLPVSAVFALERLRESEAHVCPDPRQRKLI